MKRGIKAAGKRAALGNVTPKMLRHSAAVRMAENGVPMEEIAQYLGHHNVNVTRRIYTRFSPYLRKAAAALELDARFNEPSEHFADEPQVADFMVVDALLIEPVSSSKFPANREINREFYRFRPSGPIFTPNRQADSVACS